MPEMHTEVKLLLPTFARDISQLPRHEITALKLSRKKQTHGPHIIVRASLKILSFKKLVYFSLPDSMAVHRENNVK